MEKHCERIYCDSKLSNSFNFNNKDQNHYHSTIISCGKQNLFNDALFPASVSLSKTKKLVLSKKHANNYFSPKINNHYLKGNLNDKNLTIYCKKTFNDWDDLSEDEEVYASQNSNCKNLIQKYDNFHKNRRYSFIDLTNNYRSIENNSPHEIYYSSKLKKLEKNKLHRKSNSLTDSNMNDLKSSCSTINLSNGKNTLSKKALKIAQKISIASISSELSSSASALYSLFTESNNTNINNHSLLQLNNNNNNYFVNKNLNLIQYFTVC